LLDHFAEFALEQAEKVIDGRVEKGRFLRDVLTKVIQYSENIVGKALELAEIRTSLVASAGIGGTTNIL
jgi:hypothetical protein